MLGVGLMAYASNNTFYSNHQSAEVAMRRIEAAVHEAKPKKAIELIPKDESTSGTWFYGVQPDGKDRKITYTWSVSDRALNEIDDSGIGKAILGNVTGFRVTSPATGDATLVQVALTVGEPPQAAVLKRTFRLAGPW